MEALTLRGVTWRSSHYDAKGGWSYNQEGPAAVKIKCPNCESTRFQVTYNGYAWYEVLIDGADGGMKLSQRRDETDAEMGDDFERSDANWVCRECYGDIPSDSPLTAALDELNDLAQMSPELATARIIEMAQAQEEADATNEAIREALSPAGAAA